MKTILTILIPLFCISFSWAKTEAAPSKKAATVTKAPEKKVTLQELTLAALNGKEKPITTALKQGFSVNKQDAQKRTLLMYAAFNGHTNIIQILLTAGANVNTTDESGSTALMFAASGKNLPAVKLLVKKGAKVNAIDTNEHWTPLMWAAAEGQTEIVSYLLKKGANPALKDVDGDTAESFATSKKHPEVVQVIQNHIKNRKKQTMRLTEKTNLFGRKKSVNQKSEDKK